MRLLLTWLVRLFPPGFRRRFEPDMVEQIERDYELARSRSRLRAVGFAVSTAADLVRASVAEHWSPTGVGMSSTTNRTKGDGMMRDTIRDLHAAMRSMRRAPGFTAMATGTLALAIGAVTAIFAVVDAVLLDPLPYPDPDDLVYIAASAPGSDFPPEFGVSPEFYVQYREEADLLDDVAIVNSFTATFRVGDRVERIRMSVPTPSMFAVLGVEPIRGRLPVPEDGEGAVVLSHALWLDWFGGDPEVLGRSFEILGAARTVIGVMGPDFRFPDDGTLLWIPEEFHAEGIVTGRFGQDLVARTAPGADLDAVRAQLELLASRLPERFGGSSGYARLIEQHRAVVRPLADELLGPTSLSIWVLFGAVLIVLLIACANVTNLFLVRAERRQRDLALRRAIGAGRLRLIRAQMAEVTIVALLAGVLAVALAWVGLPLLINAAPGGVPRLQDASLSASTLAFTLGACMVSAFLCGLVPAVRSAGVGLGALRDGSRGSTRSRHWARDGLVVGQTALALVLLVGSGLLVRSFQQLKSVDPGYDTEDVFTFQMAPEADHLNDGPSWARFHLDFLSRVAALPGVESVGIVENVPLNEGVGSSRFFTEDNDADAGGGVLLSFTAAGGDYFATMGIEVLRGRPFEETDHTSDLGNVVVSRSAAELLWPGQDPVGRRIQWESLDSWETVVGVVEDVMQYSFRDDPEPLVYFPMTGQSPDSWALSSPAYVVKTERADEIAPEIRALVREVAPSAPMYRVFTMEGLAADSMVELTFTMLALGIASALALILGTVGLYGVLSYVVAQRTREIGVRMALGAEARGVRKMVVAQGGRVVLLGVLVGAAVALGAARALGGLLFGVEPVDPVTFASVSMTMVLVGLLASYVPARRASSVDPVESLRTG